MTIWVSWLSKIRLGAKSLNVSVLSGPLDTTIRLKWPRKAYPEYDSTSQLASLLAPYGTVDSIVISDKYKTNPKLKYSTAVVSFRTIAAAVRCLDDAGAKGTPLEQVEGKWASGEPPAAIRGSRQPADRPPKSTTPTPTTAPRPPLNINEDEVLEKLREAERQRLEEQIRRQDEADEAAA
jgi:hypothetical protein